MKFDNSIDGHVSRLTSERVVERIVARTGAARERVLQILNMYGAEARHGFHLVGPHLPTTGRILEIGAGLGMLSSYLRETGYNIVALEPSTSGFDFFREIREAVLQESSADTPEFPIRAEELNSGQHGEFQFIFSINVLEHIGDLAAAFDGMARVLAPTGRMWHTCANYLVPYEPHFGVPLLPFFPQKTGFLLPRRISEGELWRGLNFVTYFTVKRLARKNGLQAFFQRGTLADALMRLHSDEEFAARHRGIVSHAFRILERLRLVSLVGALPPMISTPMMVTIEGRGRRAEDRPVTP